MVSDDTRIIDVSGSTDASLSFLKRQLLALQPLEFGEVEVGTRGMRTLTISNLGNAPVTVSGIECPEGFSGNWSGTIAAGATQTIRINFNPTTETSYEGELTVRSDAVSGTFTRPLRGEGIPERPDDGDGGDDGGDGDDNGGGSAISIALYGDLKFGTVAVGNTSEPQILEIENTGDRVLVVEGIDFPEGFTGDWSGGVIAVGDAQTVSVTFQPMERREYRDVVKVRSNATEGEATIDVTGTGVVRVLTLEGDLDFGGVVVGERAERTLTLGNDGDDSLEIAGIAYPFDVFTDDLGDAPVVIEPGEIREVKVTFAPVDYVDYEGELEVESDATSGENTHPVHGSGVRLPIEMVFVEGGTVPGMPHLSTSSFHIGVYEITRKQWMETRTWAAANGYDIGTFGTGCADDHPSHSANWYDVVKWCNARSEMEGLAPVYKVGGAVYRTGVQVPVPDAGADGYRLPTEREWEFAARGGKQSAGHTYSGSDNLNEVGWYDQNSSGTTCRLSGTSGTWPVGSKQPNELGIFDMSGNVWEYCWDAVGENRVIRGGSWYHAYSFAETSLPAYTAPATSSPLFGFRVARTPSP